MGMSNSSLRKKMDDYMEPGEREVRRNVRREVGVLSDSDVAAFDPMADKYDYLIVFKNTSDKASKYDETVEDKASNDDLYNWDKIAKTWSDVIPGDEEKKKSGVKKLLTDWNKKYKPEDSVTKDAFLALVREHVVDVLSRKSGLQLKLSISTNNKFLYCQVRAPTSLIERRADVDEYKLKFRDEVDPGPAFWKRSTRKNELNRPEFDELIEDAVLYSEERASEILEELYKSGQIGPNDMGIIREAEPSKKYWSRRIHTLQRIADGSRLGSVKNPYPAHAAFDNVAVVRHLYHEYPTTRGTSLFLPKDRLYLTKRVVDEVFDFGVLVDREIVEKCTALHDANYGEMPTTDWLQKRWVLFWNAEADRVGAPFVSHKAICRNVRVSWYLRPWSQPFMEIRAYFGEKIALYFAWLGFYGFYLLYPALVGLLCTAYLMSFGSADNSDGVHYEQYVMAVFLVVWSAVYKEHWDIESQYCAIKWGTDDFEEEEGDRPQFFGDPSPGGKLREISPVTNQFETFYPSDLRARTQRTSAIGIALCIVFLIVLSIVIFTAQYIMVFSLGGVFATLAAGVGIFQAVIIIVASKFYGDFAKERNELENYRTQTEFDNQLILKKFIFETFNNYLALAITAFFKGTYFQCAAGGSADANNCLGDLKALLTSIFGTRFFVAILGAFQPRIDKIQEYYFPPAVEEDSPDEQVQDEDEEAAVTYDAPRFEAELRLVEYESTFDDYAEIVLQFGLVTLFSLGLYIVPLLALFEVLLQMRVDAYKLTAQTMRPDPSPAETVGTWGTLMEAMGYLAVFFNAGIIVFTTKSFDKFSETEKLLVFFTLTQLLMILKQCTHAYIADVPTELSEIKRRQEFVVQRHKNIVFDDAVEDPEQGGEQSRGTVDADSLSVEMMRVKQLTPIQVARVEFLRRDLLRTNQDLVQSRQQAKVAQRVEIYRPDLGVSYSRQNPELALGMLTLVIHRVDDLGTAFAKVDHANCRVIVHVRDASSKDEPKAYEGDVGPPPVVSKAATLPEVSKKRRSKSVEEVGGALIYGQTFSLAPIKSAHCEVYFEVVDGANKQRLAFASIALQTVVDQETQKEGTQEDVPAYQAKQVMKDFPLDLTRVQPAPRDDAGDGALGPDDDEDDDQLAFPATTPPRDLVEPTMQISAQFQFSKLLPIKEHIFELLDKQRKIHRDITNIQIGRDHENEWDFPDMRNLDAGDRDGSDDGSDDDDDAA